MSQQAQTRDSLKKKSPRAPRFAPMPEGRPEKSEKVPAWIVVMFIFALAFCLFAVYKAFIFKQGYDLPFVNNTQSAQEVIDVNFAQLDNEELLSGEKQNENSDFGSGLLQESSTANSPTGNEALGSGSQVIAEAVQKPSLQVTNTKPQISTGDWTVDRSKDMAMIQEFYQHMVAGEFEQMNALVNAPLLRSKVRNDHWNAKNLGIFSRNLVGQLNLDNLFFVANSVNDARKSRQYTYTLNYTIQPDHHYKEDRKITLITQGTGKVLVAEIMCETKGCSRSPFFWPQNLGLK